MDIQAILDLHEKWVAGRPDGVRAKLIDADLNGAKLIGAKLISAKLISANLIGADLRGAKLIGADLRDADLSGADLRDADLRDADLRDADLSGADLSGADLSGADLRRADLRVANLRDANLRDADLSGADLSGAKNFCAPLACPDTGSFIGWKKARGKYGSLIIKLIIPAYAKRSSATGRKCRADCAFVVGIEKLNGEKSEEKEARSIYYSHFAYKLGEKVTISNFCDDRFQECAPGIHFFITREEAVNYV